MFNIFNKSKCFTKDQRKFLIETLEKLGDVQFEINGVKLKISLRPSVDYYQISVVNGHGRELERLLMVGIFSNHSYNVHNDFIVDIRLVPVLFEKLSELKNKQAHFSEKYSNMYTHSLTLEWVESNIKDVEKFKEIIDKLLGEVK